jgi:hypothetical protein
MLPMARAAVQEGSFALQADLHATGFRGRNLFQKFF